MRVIADGSQHDIEICVVTSQIRRWLKTAPRRTKRHSQYSSICFAGGGVAVLKPTDEHATFLPEVPDFKTVLAITRDLEGGLWLCDRFLGVNRLFNGKLQRFPELHREMDGWPSVAYTDHGGRVWIGLTTGEVALREGERFHVFSEKDGLSNGQVTSILSDLNGEIWVAGVVALVDTGGNIFKR